ncbi:MAG: DUF4843 domain-containing protein [Odoribacteraceae bacterium]|nr:DUF4843 domain-containing protein [Odoribacteraceae bacterium]
MKRVYTLIAAAILAACLFTACENDAFTWGNYTYARIVGPENWTLGTDSLHFTFSSQSLATTEFVMEAEIIIMGEVADHDRVVRLAIDTTRTTAVKGTHYTIPESVTIPADEVSAPCHIAIRRTPELQSVNVRLRVKIAPGGDIGPGVNEWNTLIIQWNDVISRPINWDALQEFFGEYSDMKFRFIISTLGISQFTYGEPDGMSWGAMNNYRLMLADALVRYNAEHPGEPLADENNQFITF